MLRGRSSFRHRELEVEGLPGFGYAQPSSAAIDFVTSAAAINRGLSEVETRLRATQ